MVCGGGRLLLMGKMHAMLLHWGVPSVFYTVAPNDVDNKLPTSSLGDTPQSLHSNSPSSGRRRVGGTCGQRGQPIEEVRPTLQLASGSDAVVFPLPDVSARFASLAGNPVAAALVFERQVIAFLTALLGLPPADATRKTQPLLGRQRGIFGDEPLRISLTLRALSKHTA